MARKMMGLPIFIMFAFFVGIEVKANPMERCVAIFNLEELESLGTLTPQQQLNFLCTDFASFLSCANDVMKQETGMSMREVAALLKGTDTGKALTLLINIDGLVGDLCTDGSDLREDYMEHMDCFGSSVGSDVGERCQSEAKEAYALYSEQSGTYRGKMEEPCMVAAYQFGCLGAAVHEECGAGAYDVFKRIIRKVGLFKSGLCSVNIMQDIKTDFLDSLDLTESQKDIYRVIINLKKRRK